jgi:hypothetical protein
MQWGREWWTERHIFKSQITHAGSVLIYTRLIGDVANKGWRG